MNRAERKKMEKELGIAKHRKSMSRSERFETIRNNIEHGKELQKEMKETRRLQDQRKIDAIEGSRIAFIATDLMINQNVPYIEAQERAKELYKQEIEAVSTKE